MSSHERMRASDADRDQVVERLRQAATEGRLAPHELDERLQTAFSAVTYGELDALVDDLPAPVVAPPAPRAVRAGFWRRLAASSLDGLIVQLIAGILSALLHGVGTGVGALVSIAYLTFFEGGPQGAGPGKQAFGIRVVDARTGEPIGYPRAFVRWLGRILSTLVFFIGYLWMLADAENQCWHDKLAGDVVVIADKRHELERGRGSV